MRNRYVALALAAGLALVGVAAMAADGLNLNTEVLDQKVSVHVAATSPIVAVKTSGPVLGTAGTSISLGSAPSSDCSALISQLAFGICVPIGPGVPVSPN